MPPMEEIAESIAELSATAQSPAPAPEPSAPAPETSGESDALSYAFAKEPVDAAAGRPRDASGKFAPKTEVRPEGQQQVVEGQQAAAPIAPAPKPGVYRPPVSWKPEEREGWERMLPHHQAAIARREAEVDLTLTRTAQARQFSSEVAQTLQPYMHMIQSEGSNPVQAIGELFKTAAVLRTAPPQQKAHLVAQLIVQYGVDPEMLENSYMALRQNKPAPNDPMSGIMQLLDQRLAPITQQLQTFQQREQMQLRQVEQQATQTLDQFMSDPQNEFARDVSQDMADLLELAANRGLTLSLQDAYKRATLAHPTISKIMERRMLEGGAAQQQAAAQRARQASASITDSGAPSQNAGDEDDGSVRSALTASIRGLSQSRV